MVLPRHFHSSTVYIAGSRVFSACPHLSASIQCHNSLLTTFHSMNATRIPKPFGMRRARSPTKTKRSRVLYQDQDRLVDRHHGGPAGFALHGGPMDWSGDDPSPRCLCTQAPLDTARRPFVRFEVYFLDLFWSVRISPFRPFG